MYRIRNLIAFTLATVGLTVGAATPATAASNAFLAGNTPVYSAPYGPYVASSAPWGQHGVSLMCWEDYGGRRWFYVGNVIGFVLGVYTGRVVSGFVAADRVTGQYPTPHC